MGLFDDLTKTTKRGRPQKVMRDISKTAMELKASKKKLKPVNLNDLAVEITKLEGGKVNLPISQIKEVLKLAFTHLATHDLFDVSETLRKYRKKEVK